MTEQLSINALLVAVQSIEKNAETIIKDYGGCGSPFALAHIYMLAKECENINLDKVEFVGDDKVRLTTNFTMDDFNAIFGTFIAIKDAFEKLKSCDEELEKRTTF